MNHRIKDLKRIARGNLYRNYSILIRVSIWISLIITLIETPFSMLQTGEQFSPSNIIYYIASLIINLLAIILVCGQHKMHLSLARSGQMDIKDFWAPLRNQPDRYIIANFLLFGFELLALLPVAGGCAILYFNTPSGIWIVAAILILLGALLSYLVTLNFSFVFYVLLDHEELSIIEAFRYTYKMMRSHKRRLFYLDLSFIGMYFLGILSMGIGLFWIEPYISQTTVLLYLNIQGELESTVNYYA